MAGSRLSRALRDIAWPTHGAIGLYEPQDTTELPSELLGRLVIFSRHAGTHDRLAPVVGKERCHRSCDQRLAGAVVVMPRSRAEASALIAAAVEDCPDGPIVIDGQKTDGVEPLLRACGARVEIENVWTRGHGRTFLFRSAARFDDWRAEPRNVDGCVTLPGVFSAERVDPGSRLLEQVLPSDLSGAVADLGAGWGYLSRALARLAHVTSLHLVESDAVALDCARRNVVAPEAQFHWSDVARWTPPAPLDAVVMNPPFHQGRRGAPDLGRMFIRRAAESLGHGGQLFLVANRHLPYEDQLAACFRSCAEVGGDKSFKILHAAAPRGTIGGRMKARRNRQAKGPRA